MKVQQTYSEDLISNVDQVEASIDSSGKVFRILTSNLYSNKPESITREIWSNAFDAHKDAGVADKPFEIVFPSAFRQEFMCRDFGNGLSHEFMVNKYTVLGFSTKENSNESVGKWGIGRLAPLSYTSAYTVTSYHKGMMGVYNVVTLPSGRPVVQPMMDPVPSDEPSGVCISFPVNNNDIISFKAAAKRVALGFNVKPVVVGNPSFDWESLEIINKGDSYEIYKGGYGKPLSGPMARMGCVLYPIKTDLLKTGGLVRHMNVILNLPIGALEVTPSREDLSYGSTEPTVASLDAAIEAMKASMVADLQKMIDACGSPYEAAATALQGQGSLPSGFSLKDFNYRGAVIEDKFQLPIDTMYRHYSSGYLNFRTHQIENVYYYKTEGKGRTTRVKDRISFVKKGNYNAIFVPYSDTNTRSLDQLKKFFPASFFKDLGAVQLPVVAKKPKGQLQVRDVQYKPVTITFDDGGLYIPMVNGEVAYDFQSIFGVLEPVLDKQVVRVPKGLTKKFEDSDKWVDLLEFAKDWVKPYAVDMQNVAKVYKPTVYNTSLAKLNGRGLAKYKSIVDTQELAFSCKGITTPVPANMVRKFLKAVGVVFKDSLAEVNQQVSDEEKQIFAEKYPLLGGMSHSTRQDYINLVDELHECKRIIDNLKGSV